MAHRGLRSTRTILMLVFALVILLVPMAANAANPPAANAPVDESVVGRPHGERAYVRASLGLQLRAEPCLGSRALMSLPNGTLVYVVDTEPVIANCIYWSSVSVYRWGRWYGGFVATRYLSWFAGKPHDLDPDCAVPDDGNDYAEVRVSELNLRSGPGTGYAVRYIVPEGAMFMETGEFRHGWVELEITCPGVTDQAVSGRPHPIHVWAWSCYLDHYHADATLKAGADAGIAAEGSVEMLSEINASEKAPTANSVPVG